MIKAEEKITLVRVDDGEGGKSAYEAAVEAGYTGTEEQFNLDLVEVPNKASITQVTMIQERVNSVEGIVDTLETNVGDLGTRITTIQGKVEQAEQDIAEITISAEQARTDAQAANQSATEAKTAATEAKTSAQQAIADAATAQTAAETAQTAAETAQSSANTALTKAEQAITDAQTANEAAQQAKESAASAKTDAETAKSSAQSAIESAAGAAFAAQTAQDAAEAAQGDIDLQQSYFWHDDNGSHVLSAEHGFQSNMQSTGMGVVDLTSGQQVAFFGVENAITRIPMARIGRDDYTHLELTNMNASYWYDNTNKFLEFGRTGNQGDYAPFFTFGSRATTGIIGNYSSVFGYNCEASGTHSFAMGHGAVASGNNSFAVNGTASGVYSVAFGTSAVASGDNSFAVNGTASGINSVAFGGTTSGFKSASFGSGNIVAGGYNFAAGLNNIIYDTNPSVEYSFAIGNGSKIYSTNAFAGGGATIDSNSGNSFAFGHEAKATGFGAIAIGQGAKANGNGAVALGAGTIADANGQIVVGRNNVKNSNYDFIVGNGTTDQPSGRHNCFYINGGNVYADGYITATNMPSLPFAVGTYVLVGSKNATGQKGTFTWQNQILACNPVGVVIMTNNSENPATAYGGGTWNQLGTKTVGTKTVYYWERTK